MLHVFTAVKTVMILYTCTTLLMHRQTRVHVAHVVYKSKTLIKYLVYYEWGMGRPFYFLYIHVAMHRQTRVPHVVYKSKT